MRQVSVTEHRHSTFSAVYIDGQTTMANNREEIGKILAAAGIAPNTRVNWMAGNGNTDRLMASQFLPPVSVKRKEKHK
ncbi:hypothetical protein [Ruegeria arenilitoris]|uniref:hypothetical protein n=1 Tax=Ruegeria arenilitoris TaxID=1173585 RepID=UPI003C79E6E4